MALARMPAEFSFFVLATIFLIIHASPTFGEEAITPDQFSYVGDKGPANWGNLNPEFSACSNGKSQSPIDISRGNVVVNTNLKPLNRRYNSINATLVNSGFNIGLKSGENSGILVSEGKTYKFKQMHWHSPSEHRINGIQYDAELHLVHIADDDSIAVVGILYRLGHPDPLIAKIHNKLHQLAKEQSGVHEGSGGEVAVGTLSMRELNENTRKYYRYAGSLTTPPCTETVAWHILGKVRSISREQLEALKAPLGCAYKNNSRPAQPLNGRQIELYKKVN